MEQQTSACHAKVDANYILGVPIVGKHCLGQLISSMTALRLVVLSGYPVREVVTCHILY